VRTLVDTNVVERMRLLTRDATRYRAYFPALEIVAP
jgi:hypothetical protein